MKLTKLGTFLTPFRSGLFKLQTENCQDHFLPESKEAKFDAFKWRDEWEQYSALYSHRGKAEPVQSVHTGKLGGGQRSSTYTLYSPVTVMKYKVCAYQSLVAILTSTTTLFATPFCACATLLFSQLDLSFYEMIFLIECHAAASQNRERRGGLPWCTEAPDGVLTNSDSYY